MSIVNVFGSPILQGDRQTRAAEAYEKMNDGRNFLALQYVQNEKAKFGNGISALSLIYNATGDPINVGANHDYHGEIFDSYPLIIQNGQWGGFLHTKTPGAIAGSEAAVIYQGKTVDEEDCDILIAHGIPYIGSNHAYTDVGKSGQFTNWDDIQNKLEDSGSTSSKSFGGILSVVSIDVGTSPYFKTILAYESETKEARR